MNFSKKDKIKYVKMDNNLKKKWKTKSQWDERIIEEVIHLEDGFAISAMINDEPIGIISIYWKVLPNPIPHTIEGYIDVIEVVKEHRRKGIAERLIGFAAIHAKKYGAYQLRAWSSEDKKEAIPMWRSLNFSVCPATTYPKGHEIKGVYATKIL